MTDITDDIGYTVLALVLLAIIIITCVINRYYRFQLCERWGDQWYTNIKITRRHQGCPLRVNRPGASRPSTAAAARSRRDNPGTVSHVQSNNRVNVNVISSTTCNINIQVEQMCSRGRFTNNESNSHQPLEGAHNNRDTLRTRNYDIFSTSARTSSANSVIQNNRNGATTSVTTTATTSPYRTASNNYQPAFGIPPPSFESVTSSEGLDPACLRQSSISSHSHSPPPSFESSVLYSSYPAFGPAPPEIMNTPPEYDTLHHGPPPAYESIFPS